MQHVNSKIYTLFSTNNYVKALSTVTEDSNSGSAATSKI